VLIKKALMLELTMSRKRVKMPMKSSCRLLLDPQAISNRIYWWQCFFY